MCCKDDSTTPTLPPTSAPTPGSCNFETGLCGWTVDSTAPAKFQRGQGETPSRNTGPRYDHTKEDSTGINPLSPKSIDQRQFSSCNIFAP